MGKVSVLIRRKENVFQILIVEDDKELSQLFQKVLEKNGYQVKSASDGAQALEVLDKEYIDLIISDIMMSRLWMAMNWCQNFAQQDIRYQCL